MLGEEGGLIVCMVSWASHITEWGPNNTHWAKPLLTRSSKRTWNTDVTSAFAMKLFLAWKWNESWTIEIHEAQVLCGPVSLSNFYKDFLSILWAMKIVGEAVQPAVGHRLSTLLGNIQQRWASSATSWQRPWTLGRAPPQVVLVSSRTTFKVSLVTCNKIMKLQRHRQECCIHAVSFCCPCNVESKEERYFHFWRRCFFLVSKIWVLISEMNYLEANYAVAFFLCLYDLFSVTLCVLIHS